MVDRPEHRCLPIETEPLPLHREPGAAKRRRELEREGRRERGVPPNLVERIVTRLARGRVHSRRRL